jgi:hypothetical protein
MKKKYRLLIYQFMIIGLIISLSNSCKKEETDIDGFQNANIGENYGGGIVFYIDATNKHGLIAALTNQTSSENIEWGCVGTYISGTGTAIGDGQNNTTAIVKGCSTSGIAAHICDQLELNGYNDWFLPSKDELNLMYLNLHAKGLGSFSNFLYWSSSQIDSDNVWGQNFWDESPFFKVGGQYPVNKFGDLYVRAIRAF